MENQNLAIGRYVEFQHNGFRLGRICKIDGNLITVILAPFAFKGKNEGSKKRIHKNEITGIVYWKKVRPCKFTK